MKQIAYVVAAAVAGVGLGYFLFGDSAAANPDEPVKLIMLSEEPDGTWEGKVNNNATTMKDCQDQMNAGMKEHEAEPLDIKLDLTTLFVCVPLAAENEDSTPVFAMDF